MRQVIGNEKAGLAAQLEAVEKRVANLENIFAELYSHKDVDSELRSCNRKRRETEEEVLEAVEKIVDIMETKFAEFEASYDFDSSQSRKKLKRGEEEEEEKDESSKSKIGIFIHVIGMASAFKYKFASSLYKIEMDSDKYFNPSPSFMSFQHDSPIVKCTSNPHSIKPVFNFTFQHRIIDIHLAWLVFFSALITTFTLWGVPFPTHYTSINHVKRPKIYATKLSDLSLDSTDLKMYPPHVYVFDCFTCQLLSPQHSPPPMNSGKSANPFTFVEKNKLYVLSSSTDVPKELDMFEVFDPDSCTWTILTNPPYDWTKLKKPLGSVLIDGVFFVSFAKDYHPDNPVHLFSYNIADDKWNEKLSVSRPLKRGISVVPSFERDSVFVQNKLYSANARPLFQNSLFKFPVLSYGPIPTTAKLDAYAVDEVVTPNLTPIFPLDACWPTYDGGIQGLPYVRLVHLGGLLQGTKTDTTCFGSVQVVGQLADETGCYIRFVAYKDAANSYFELPDECGPFFKARTLHASHFYSPDKSQFSFVNAVCALVLS